MPDHPPIYECAYQENTHVPVCLTRDAAMRQVRRGPTHLGKFLAVFGFEVALHVGHEFVQAKGQVRLAVRRLRRYDPVPERRVDLQRAAHTGRLTPCALLQKKRDECLSQAPGGP